MFVVRPITHEDKDALQTFSKATLHGVSNLPLNPLRQAKIIEDGVEAFHSVTPTGKEIYPFILENYETGEKVGTCSIIARVGQRDSYCSYYLENLPEGDSFPPEGCLHALLYPRYYENGPSELCALYLVPAFRKGGLGKLLALSRLLFIAGHLDRFNDTLFADLRGHTTSDGQSPFWSAIGAKLWRCDYQEILRRLDDRTVEMRSLLPRYPLHWCLLPLDAQICIGKTHPNTQAAYYMLNREGLVFQHEISILDGGPLITAPIKTIYTVAHSQRAVVSKVVPQIESGCGVALISNDELANFRACQAPLLLGEPGQVILEIDTARALNLSEGSALRFCYLRTS